MGHMIRRKTCGSTIGIVGLLNVGKSTLFNALTGNTVLVANHPFATIDPGRGEPAGCASEPSG